MLGYHGCDADVARRAVLDGSDILQSQKDYDWLGLGAYFWESDPIRAKEWADWKVSKGDYKEVNVIGAVIDLGNCLDLVSRHNIEILRAAYRSFKRLQKLTCLPLPKNMNPKGTHDKDRLLRYLDCAVLRHLHENIEDLRQDDPSLEPFDTVRGMFVEGGKAFPGSGMYLKSHVQIAVRNPACIRGIFFPRHEDLV